MRKAIRPITAIKRSSQTASPQTGAAAIMDDTVYTMDDSRVMMGGQTTVFADIRARIALIKPRASIKIRR